MRIVHLSDSHNQHHQMASLPQGDIIIHSGDFSFAGTESEAMDFIQWFSHLPYAYKIFISGNHDNFMHGAEIEGLPDDCYYLCNSSVTIQGLKFYGVPMFMEDIILGEYDPSIGNIPDDTDILITHQPPHGILDAAGNTHFGDKSLQQVVAKIQPRYHLFGHIHDAYGMEKVGETVYSNASVVNENYQLINKPFIFEV